ncbi:hypothetical protein R1T16_09970 [Flavobacterium sp. DG1-102-2]|uniref:hypothetical protein n=1 Tax=Flavobacterium sp. DG1-102-2 TaxID=3081663 RepID=UPI002949CE57|nr:hypothetical protein [Flavobacterium sp. DG1-102-2]MDV6168752.1 hypothetical protein [Flavobacterium sp. DG1-102-2]
MKYLYPLSLLLLLVSCQKEEKKVVDRKKADWSFYKLEGDVKSIGLKSWQVNDKLEKIKTLHEDMSKHDSEMVFDDNGMLVSEKSYLSDKPFEESTYKGREKKQQTLQYIGDAVGIKIDYDYDKSGNNTAITRRNPDNSQIDRIEMKYQGKNIAQKTTFSAQNNPNDKVAYLYDSKGNIIQEDIYLASESVQYKAVNKYDKKNRKISEARYDKDSKKLYETVSKYDGDNLMKKFTVDAKGVVDYSEDFTYDDKGNVLTHLTFEKFDNSKTLDMYAYDDKGNKREWAVEKNGKPFMKASFDYDDKNNTTVISVTDAAGKQVDKREYAYDYDKKGNWTKKTIRINGVPQFVEERQIVYADDAGQE